MRVRRDLPWVLPVALILGLVAGCADGESRPAGEDVPLTAATEEVFSIGGATLEEWQLFSVVSAVHFDRDGNLVVVDERQEYIVVVDPEGRFRHTVSRSGDGPGELQRIYGAAALPDNGLVVHSRLQDLIVFDATGEFVEQFSFSDTVTTTRQTGGGNYSVTTIPVLRAVLPDGRLLMTRSRALEIHALGGEAEEIYRAFDPLALIPESRSAGGSLRIGETDVVIPVGMLPRRLVFGPSVLVDVLADGRIAVVDSVSYQVKVLRSDGSIEGVFERPIEPVPVTRAMREDFEQRSAPDPDNASDPVTAAFSRQFLEAMAARRVFASEVPVIKEMAVDGEGRIWVTRTAADGESGGPTDVLASDGEYLGTLAADDFRIPDAFGPNGLMAYIETDDLDVPSVRVVRLVGLGSGSSGTR